MRPMETGVRPRKKGPSMGFGPGARGGGGGGNARTPQSAQSVPCGHAENSAPGPSSSQMPSEA